MSADTETLTHCPWPVCGLPLHQWNRLVADGRWCGACQCRWRRAKCPESGPPPAQANGASYRQLRSEQTAEQAQRARELANQGLTPQQIAARLGVGDRTVRRYLKSRKQGGDGVSDLRSDVLYLSMSQTRETAQEPKVELGQFHNGHELDGTERSVLEGAVREARKRDHSILGGLTR